MTGGAENAGRINTIPNSITLRSRKVCDSRGNTIPVEETVFRATLEGYGHIPKERIDFYRWEIPLMPKARLGAHDLLPMYFPEELDPRNLVPERHLRGPLGLAITYLLRWDPGPLAGALKVISRLVNDEVSLAVEDLRKTNREGFSRFRDFCRTWHLKPDALGIMTLSRALDFQSVARDVLETHGTSIERDIERGMDARHLYVPLLTANDWQDLFVAASVSRFANPPRKLKRLWDSRWILDFVQLCRWELFHHISRNVSVKRCRICHQFVLVELGRVFDCWWCRRTTGTAKQRSRKAARDREIRKLSLASP